MAKSGLDKLVDLLKRYQYFLWAGALIFAGCLVSSLWIYYHLEDHPRATYWFKVADFLMNVGQTMLGTVLIGGGLGGIVNFILEEQKKEEEDVKNRYNRMKEKRDKRKQLRQEMRNKLQRVHDDVALARVLIKSHRSGRTYGEQIRTRIMPGNIALQDMKRQLAEHQDEEALVQHLPELQVSLTYMSAYLSVLIEEFAQHYLDIANLQNYQDALASRRHTLFTEVVEHPDHPAAEGDPKLTLLQNPAELLKEQQVPNRMEVVWEAMERLDYVWDFIADVRNDKGETSLYQNFFLDHHFHALRLLSNKDSQINEKLCRRAGFQGYLNELQRLTEKKHSDQPITKNDSLTRMIMVEGLKFDFEEMRRVR
ncbi:MAG: hypothetical protein KDC54_02835 [Lewinella sp.]|nr:hypothetical protein [Lewinella sp.]